MFSYKLLLFIMNLTMKLLQRFHFSALVSLHIVNTLCGGSGSSDRCHIGDFSLDGCFSQIAVVVYTVLAHRGVDDQIDFSVGDQIQCIRASLGAFLYKLCRDSCLTGGFISSHRGNDVDSVFMEKSGYFHNFFFILAVYGNQYRTLQRQLGLSCLLGFVEGFTVGRGQT